jgi:hypothetical protein
MFKKTLIVTMVLLVLLTGTLVAQKASVFDLGISHSYRYDNAEAMDYQAYVPGARVQLNIRPWFGISVGGLYDFVEGMEDVHKAYLAAELVLRAPLGFFEPFIACGPMYSYTMPETVSVPDTYGMQARAGFDILFNGWFGLGLEGVVVAPSLTDLVDGAETFNKAYVMDHLFIGFTVKAKF